MADYEDVKVTDLVINNISQEKYDELKTAGQLEATQIYLTPTEEGGSGLPDQTDNAGKFLKTDGSEASWGETLPYTEYSSDSIVAGFTRSGYMFRTTAFGKNITLPSTPSTATAFGSKLRLGNGTIVFGVDINAIGIDNVVIGSAQLSAGVSNCIVIGKRNPDVSFGESKSVIFATYDNDYKLLDLTDGTIPAERLKNLVEVLPTADNGYTTVKNFGNGYVEITGYASIGTVGAGTGSEVQIDLPSGYTMADANYWVNIAPTSETTMFDFKAEAKARSATHFMVAYKNEDDATGLTAAGVYWEVRGMLAITES